MPYCSEDCQLEHWSEHKKICKKLSGSEPVRKPVARYDTKMIVRGFKLYFDSDTTSDFPIQFPFKVDRDPHYGWINEYLCYIYSLVVKISGKGVKITGLFGFEIDIFTLWSFYFFLLATEKERKLTELKFAMRFSANVEAPKILNEEWEALFFALAKFYQTLRMVKYKFINVETFQKNRPEDFEVLRPFYENGIRVLNSATGWMRMNVDGQYETKNCRETLPPGSRCAGCDTDLGGKKAQILGRKNCSFRVTAIPCVIGITNPSNPIAICGRMEKCYTKAKEIYLTYLCDEEAALMKFLPNSQICHGCSRYSMKTHRCSRCREARFCSQDCLNTNWGDHKVRCREFIRPGIQELYTTRKLKGKAKQRYTAECQEKLAAFDTFFHCGFGFSEFHKSVVFSEF